MSITAETAKQHANDPAVLCCRAEAGITIEPANLEDPAIFDELVDSGLLNLDGCLKIGQVLGAKLTKTSDSLSPLTADNMEGYKDSVEEEAPAEAAEQQPDPVAADVFYIDISVDWGDVPAEQIPDSLYLTVVPDGIAFMASNVLFDAEHEWKAQVQALPGTKHLEVKEDKIDGLEDRLLGNVEEGYQLQYFPLGQMPKDNAATATRNVQPHDGTYAGVETRKVSITERAPGAVAISTREGESLTPSELAERQLQAELEAQGLVMPNRTLYMIGVIICLILIVVVIALRILLGRHH